MSYIIVALNTAIKFGSGKIQIYQEKSNMKKILAVAIAMVFGLTMMGYSADKKADPKAEKKVEKKVEKKAEKKVEKKVDEKKKDEKKKDEKKK